MCITTHYLPYVASTYIKHIQTPFLGFTYMYIMYYIQ